MINPNIESFVSRPLFDTLTVSCHFSVLRQIEMWGRRSNIVWSSQVLIKRIAMQLLPGWSWCYPPTLYHELLWRCSSLSTCQLLFLPLPGCLFFRQCLTTLALMPGLQKVGKFILITCEAWLDWHHTELHGGTACSNSMSANQFFSQQHSSLAWKLWHGPCLRGVWAMTKKNRNMFDCTKPVW